MVNLCAPYTYENSSNPWLMDKKDISDVIEINNKKITAEYLWSLSIDERIDCLNNVYEYYRANGFPYINLSEKEIQNEVIKLQKYNVEHILTKNGFISNSVNIGINLCKYFCKEYFYKAKGKNSLSVEDIFYDDELFIKVLKNRMGWNTTKEDGIERPYMFPISDKQILNGIRNSGLGYGVSNFRPVVAKWMYSHAIELLNHKETNYNVFDYSCGWGARALGALSLSNVNYSISYHGTDPLTYRCVESLCCACFSRNYKLYNRCSEDNFFMTEHFKGQFDIIGSCPPYFDLEVYSSDENQSIHNKMYDEWLNSYWDDTVKNMYYMLKDDGIFILVIKESYNKYNLKDDMSNILINNGFTLLESYQYNTNVNHLSNKSMTGRTTKNNEYIMFYKK